MLIKESDHICLFHSALLIQSISWIKKRVRKASYWQKHNKHSQKQQLSSLQSPPNLLDCSVMRNKHKACGCARELMCVHCGVAMCSTLAQYNPRPLPAAHRSFKTFPLELKTGGHSLISLLKNTCYWSVMLNTNTCSYTHHIHKHSKVSEACSADIIGENNSCIQGEVNLKY